jgi:hypothetical protein
MVLLIERLARETPPRRDEATREIDMTPELMSMHGKSDFLESD